MLRATEPVEMKKEKKEKKETTQKKEIRSANSFLLFTGGRGIHVVVNK